MSEEWGNSYKEKEAGFINDLKSHVTDEARLLMDAPDEELCEMIRMRSENAKPAFEALTVRNIKTVRQAVGIFHESAYNSYTAEDIEQAGYQYIYDAAVSFRSGKREFASHLYSIVQQHVAREMAENGNQVRMPYRRLMKAQKDENADYLNLILHDSLDMIIVGEDGEEAYLHEITEDSRCRDPVEMMRFPFNNEMHCILDSNLLNEDERDVIQSMYGIECEKEKISSIAEEMGVTAGRISQLKNSAMKKLRNREVMERLMTYGRKYHVMCEEKKRKERFYEYRKKRLEDAGQHEPSGVSGIL